MAKPLNVSRVGISRQRATWLKLIKKTRSALRRFSCSENATVRSAAQVPQAASGMGTWLTAILIDWRATHGIDDHADTPGTCRPAALPYARPGDAHAPGAPERATGPGGSPASPPSMNCR